MSSWQYAEGFLALVVENPHVVVYNSCINFNRDIRLSRATGCGYCGANGQGSCGETSGGI